MRAIALILAACLAALVVPAAAGAQDNSGVEQYTPSPPTPEGEPPTDEAPTDTATGTEETTDATATTASGETASSTGTLSEAEAGASATEAAATVAGEQLPATGSETTLLAIVGAVLLVGGIALRRMVVVGG
jgi:LPXTG-motif cell wall-anchored protein